MILNSTFMVSIAVSKFYYWVLSFVRCGICLYRPALYRFVGIHHPLNLNTIKSVLGFVCGLILALLIGNATHLIWDGLTHHDFRSFAFQDFLAQSVQLGTGIYPMHRVLQIGSLILALPFLLWMSLHYYRKHRQVSSVSKKIRVYAIALILLSIVLWWFWSLWDYARYIPDATWQAELYYFTGRAINEFSQGALLMLSLGCLLISDFRFSKAVNGIKLYRSTFAFICRHSSVSSRFPLKTHCFCSRFL